VQPIGVGRDALRGSVGDDRALDARYRGNGRDAEDEFARVRVALVLQDAEVRPRVDEGVDVVDRPVQEFAFRVRLRQREPDLVDVEDEDGVRALSVEMLRDLGYRVVEAADGPSALAALEREPSVRLLFTDVGLPGGMDGRQLAEAAQRRRPGLKVLFTTGYARNAIVHHGRLDPGVELITKPFAAEDLGHRVRAVLDAV